MDTIERMYFERDHNEALRIAQQLAIASAGVNAQHVIDLNRFHECCEDGEGYDVPKERMRDLKAVGLVEGGRFGFYKTTDEGMRIREVWFDMSPMRAALPEVKP